MPFLSASGISPYNKIRSGASAEEPSASAYIIAAGITDPVEKAAANQFVLDLTGKGSTTNNTNQWDKHYALYPMSPTDLSASAYNIKNPTEYTISWLNNPTHSVDGVSGNGINQYGNTNFNLATDSADLKLAIGAWLNVDNILNEADMGAQDSAAPNSGAFIFPHNASTHDASTVGEYTGGTTPMNANRDEFMLVQNNGTNLQKFRNGVSYYDGVQALGTASSDNVFILARNLGGANALSSKQTSFNHISKHLTQNEITDLYDAVYKYNVSMSRFAINPYAAAWIAAGSVTDTIEKAAVNQFTLNLKGIGATPNNSNVWDSLHWINLVSATSLTASLNDLKGNYNLTAYNSPTWSQTGIQGNGTNMYLLTSYIAQNDGSILDSNSFGCAVRTTQTTTGASFMGVRNASVNPYNAMVEFGGSRYYGNNSPFVQDVGAGQFPNGIFINNRTTPQRLKIYFDNVLDFDVAAPNNNRADIPMGILCQNNDGAIAGFSDMEFTVAFEGQGLTANQMEDFNAAINTLNSTIIAGGRNFEGILDSYPNSKVAFSLRRLTANYTGDLIKVRRSSGGEQDIGYNSSNELDTVALLAFVGAGDGFVTTWYDQSGNVSDAAQATAANQFQIVDSGVVNVSNGKPSLLVSPSAPQRMDTASITESAERSQFCVIEKVGTGIPPYDSIYLHNTPPYMQMYVPNASTTFNYYNGANEELSGAVFTLNTQQLINSNQGSASGNVYLNGVNQVSTTPPIAGATGNLTAPIVLGGFGSNGMEGNMSEYINWEGDKSSDRLGIEANIKSFYNTF